jgi:hypothetical protein
MTISEVEYNQLQLTIQQLMVQLSKFRQPTLPKKQTKTPNHVLTPRCDRGDYQIAKTDALDSSYPI